MRQELITVNPMDRLDPIVQPKREPRPLPPEDVAKIMKAVPAANLRDRTIFMLLYETGVRVGEILALQWNDVTLSQDDEKIRIFAKGQREHTVMLTAAPESIRLLHRHLKHSHITSGSIFRGDPRYGGGPLPLDYKQRCAMSRWIRQRSSRICKNISGERANRDKLMMKTYSWSTDSEEMRRLFTLTYDDLHFLEPLRADAQRLYRALVVVWARVERVLVSDPDDLPEEVIQHVSKQLSLTPKVLGQLHNHPSARSTTFEAVRKHLEVRVWQESDATALSEYLVEKVAHTGNPSALFDAATDWMVRAGVLRPQGETTIDRLVYQVRNRAEDTLFEYLVQQLSEEDRRKLDALLVPLMGTVASLGWALHHGRLLFRRLTRSVSAWCWFGKRYPPR